MGEEVPFELELIGKLKKKKKKSLKSKKLQISNKIKKEKETNSLVTLIQSKRD